MISIPNDITEFNDTEDYFIEFFDESNEEWDIRISKSHPETVLKLNITKSKIHKYGAGHAHRNIEKEVNLIKLNKLDKIMSDSMSRLADSKNLIAKYKKKRLRHGQFIGYECVLFGYNQILEKVGGKEISSIDNYISGLSKSKNDKLFFLDKVKTDLIVDFGCADGSIISEIKQKNPEIKVIGYDIDETMLFLARSKNKKILFTDSWELVMSEVRKSKSPCLNLSSVIHEVYSYSTSKIIKEFWEDKVFGSGFKWITIRDMIPSTKMSYKNIEEFEEDIKKVKEKSSSKYLKSFEDKWGIIDDNYRTFVHFLLKYKYEDNWGREVLENYLPLGLETLKKKIPPNYKIFYENSFILPYLSKSVKADFGIDLSHSTHTKMIIKSN